MSMLNPTNFLTHATVADLTTWTGGAAPVGAERLIRRATELVDAHTTTDYAMNETTGVPTDVVIAIALRDAVCAQVEQWILTGEVNDIDGMDGQAVSVGGLSVTRPRRIAPRAATILRNADLL